MVAAGDERLKVIEDERLNLELLSKLCASPSRGRLLPALLIAFVMVMNARGGGGGWGSTTADAVMEGSNNSTS